MNRIGALFSFLGIVAAASAASPAWAQDFGDPAQGQALARQICSECHAIDQTQQRSPNPAAPRFEVIANVPGMTSTALTAALQTSHRAMPNVMLDADQLSNIIAYILRLKNPN